ncbi:SARP family transcriptional regulator [Deinococcus seoulensis]|uniref:SARP family transcriptional regulator n=1 Tax=Deinococcus seoulensis TaxID=1837379 RepID=A0ABQ2RXK4_9DEIO|nr:tetratricopeptide repeat protein [Deinococcus seoulensis]GGR76386.1 SARP family transcriptional regulator [Deinococcus seoulensis]
MSGTVPHPLQAQLLGAPTFTWTGQEVRVPPRLAALLAFLALEGPADRENLLELFWPGGSSQHLRQALYSLRQQPGSSDWLQERPGTVAVHVTTDVSELELLLSAALPPAERLRAWPTGAFLETVHLDRAGPARDWVRHHQERLQQAQAQAFDRWGNQELQRGNPEALDVARCWVATDPLSEAAAVLMMRVQARTGNLAEVKATWNALRRSLRQALDAEPSDDTRTVYETLSGDGGQRGLARLITTSDESFDPDEPLHGRDSELARLVSLLRSGERVIVHGLPGMGKTRLAMAVASRYLQGGESILWCVIGNDRPDATLSALQDALQSHRQPLPDALRHRNVTLCVLDDVWSQETLSALLSVLPPELPVLVTSRTRWPGLIPLTLPRLARPDAEALLTSHASGNEDPHNERDALCALLGDHPLALRLAGRTMHALNWPSSQLAQALHDSPHTVGGGYLAALLHCSVSTLSAPEYEAYLGMGSLPVPAVTPELLSMALRRDVQETEQVLYSLMLRGLISRAATPGSGTVRYLMHELTWSHARTHRALQVKTVYQAALTYAAQHANTPATLDAERPLLIEVVRQASQEEPDLLIDLFTAWLGGAYIAARGFPTAHLDLLKNAAERAARTQRWPQAATLYGKLADIQHGLLGDGISAAQHYSCAAQMAGQAGLVERQATFLGLGATVRAIHHLPETHETLQQAVICAQRSADPICLARIHEQRGFILAMTGDFSGAVTAFETARVTLRPHLASPHLLSAAQSAYLSATSNLAQAEQRLGQLEQAASHREEALELAIERDEHLRIAHAHADLGEVRLLQGLHDLARAHLQQAISLYRTLGAASPETATRVLLGTIPPPTDSRGQLATE